MDTVSARWLLLVTLSGVACGGTGSTPSESPGVTTTATPAANDVTRIMPLGDSITQADSDHDSYRRPLWKALEAAGYAVDFVGSERSHHRGGPPNPDFDLDHEGHWGWRVDEILTHLPDWVRAHEPDVLLVHLGSNDLFQRQTVEDTLDELSELVDIVREIQPGATFLVAQILPTTTEAANRRIRELNARLPELASEKATAESPVLVVDQYTGFDAETMTYDGVHPSLEGERHMAERFFEALETVLP